MPGGCRTLRFLLQISSAHSPSTAGNYHPNEGFFFSILFFFGGGGLFFFRGFHRRRRRRRRRRRVRRFFCFFMARLFGFCLASPFVGFVVVFRVLFEEKKNRCGELH